MVELVTKLVVLATAVVGLIKVATLPRGKSESSGSQGSLSLGPIGGLLTILAFMLFPLIYIYLFSFLFNAISGIGNDPANDIAFSPFTVAAESQEGDAAMSRLVVQAAMSVDQSRERERLLECGIQVALVEGRFDNALIAARAMASARSRDKALSEIIRSALERGDHKAAVTAVSLYDSPRAKASAAQLVVDSLVSRSLSPRPRQSVPVDSAAGAL